jgi:hypothetical protein
MGIDAMVLVTIRKDAEDVEPTFRPIGYHWDGSLATKATHVYDEMCGRYWSPRYNRGCWPYIVRVLLDLMTDERVEKVWYGPDDGDEPFTLMTPKALLGLTKEWLDQNMIRRR